MKLLGSLICFYKGHDLYRIEGHKSKYTGCKRCNAWLWKKKF